jgi:hypothetical protein
VFHKCDTNVEVNCCYLTVKFWSSFMHQLSCQNHDGSAMSVVASVMIVLPDVGVLSDVTYFRFVIWSYCLCISNSYSHCGREIKLV